MNIPREYKFWRYPLLLKLRYWLTTVLYKNTVCVKYWLNANTFAWTGKIKPYNWGDYMNLILAEYISGKKVIPQQILDTGKSIAMVGSILPWAMDKHTIVWGSGCLDSNEKGWQFVEKPLKVSAVRGPLTREVLIKHNIDCPEIYGDPILCLPRYYQPAVNKTDKIVIIPHVSCIQQAYELCQISKEVTILNPSKFKSWQEFVDVIVSCKLVLSASLHGLIVADAYGIPNVWVSFPNHVHPDNNFKFHDYFNSVGKETIISPIDIEDMDLTDTEKYISSWSAPIIDIDKLLSACPLC